jgi:hypothetical protein
LEWGERNLNACLMHHFISLLSCDFLTSLFPCIFPPFLSTTSVHVSWKSWARMVQLTACGSIWASVLFLLGWSHAIKKNVQPSFSPPNFDSVRQHWVFLFLAAILPKTFVITACISGIAKLLSFWNLRKASHRLFACATSTAFLKFRVLWVFLLCIFSKHVKSNSHWSDRSCKNVTGSYCDNLMTNSVLTICRLPSHWIIASQ